MTRIDTGKANIFFKLNTMYSLSLFQQLCNNLALFSAFDFTTKAKPNKEQAEPTEVA